MLDHKKNILFDLDGTIVNSKQGIINWIIAVLEHFDYPLPNHEDLDWCVGPPVCEIFAKLINSNDSLLLEKITNYSKSCYHEKWLFESKLYPNIEKVLKNLNQNDKKIFLATSRPRHFAHKLLKYFSLDHHFQNIYGSELNGRFEDKTELISHIIEQENLNHQETVMIGDRKYDIIGANNNKIDIISVSWGFGSMKELSQYNPQYIYHTPEDILNHLI